MINPKNACICNVHCKVALERTAGIARALVKILPEAAQTVDGETTGVHRGVNEPDIFSAP